MTAANDLSNIIQQGGPGAQSLFAQALAQIGSIGAGTSAFNSDINDLSLWLGPQQTEVQHIQFEGKTYNVITPTGVGIHIQTNSSGRHSLVVTRGTGKHMQAIYRTPFNPDLSSVVSFDQGGQPPALDLTDDLAGIAGAQSNLRTVQQEMKNFYGADQQTIHDVNYKLWLAGYYGQTPLDQVDLNTPTSDTFKGVLDVMLNAARMHEAGHDITWQDYLNQLAGGPAAQARQKSHGVGGFQIHDATSIQETATQVAQQVLGRYPTPDEMKVFVAQQQTNEIGANVASSHGGVGEVPDVAASATAYFRNLHPDQAGAVKYADRTSDFMSLLASSVPTEQVKDLG